MSLSKEWPTYWVCNNHGVKGRNDNSSYKDHCDQDHEGTLITTSWTNDQNQPRTTVGPLC